MNKFDFNNSSHWNEEKISQFLIWDYLDTLASMGYSGIQDQWLKHISSNAKKYSRYKCLVKCSDSIYNRLVSKLYIKRYKESAKKILFQSKKYPPIILRTKEYYPSKLIAAGRVDRLWALRNFIGYTSIADLYQYLYNYLTKRDVKYLYELINKAERKIRDIRPKYIVLMNDSLPIERAIILISKKLGITTVVIQHGIYSLIAPLFDGKIADYVLVWGKYFEDLYINQGLKRPEEIYILGYPYLIEKDKSYNREKGYYTVYYLGHDLERFIKKLLSIEIKTIKEINKICHKLRMKFIYRPHPWEDRTMLKAKLPEISFSPKSEKITGTFNNGDIFISFNSTSLIEAAIRSKVCFQLMNFPGKTDNFEKLNVCNKTFKTIGELEDQLRKIAGLQNLNEFKSKFNNDYINLSYSPGRRFLEILDDIERNKRSSER